MPNYADRHRYCSPVIPMHRRESFATQQPCRLGSTSTSCGDLLGKSVFILVHSTHKAEPAISR